MSTVTVPDLEPFRAVTANPRRTFDEVVARFRKHELVLRASAIAFQMLTVVVPFALFTTALLGFFGLEQIYDRDVAPKLQDQVSIPAYALIDDTVRQVLGSRHVEWVTIGLGIAVWQLSGVVRTVGSTLDHLFGVRAKPPFRERLGRSLMVAAGVAACLLGALCAAAVAPLVYGDVGPILGAVLWLARHAVAGGLLLVAIGLVVRTAPSKPQPVEWVSVGALLSTVCWLAVTAAFGAYVSALASFGSIYGAFVGVVVLLAWMYASAFAFLVGVAVDDVVRSKSN